MNEPDRQAPDKQPWAAKTMAEEALGLAVEAGEWVSGAAVDARYEAAGEAAEVASDVIEDIIGSLFT